jgi:hypothetical protein
MFERLEEAWFISKAVKAASRSSDCFQKLAMPIIYVLSQRDEQKTTVVTSGEYPGTTAEFRKLPGWRPNVVVR